jgi:hypothetical protein
MAIEGLSKKAGTWDALAINVRARLQEVPHLTETVEAFAGVIGEIREFQGVHDSHSRHLREATQRSKDLEHRARSLRNRLVTGLQSAYGPENLVLLDFGINPRLPAKPKRLTREAREAAKLAEAQRIIAEAAGKQG